MQKLNELTLLEARKKLLNKEITSYDLVSACLKSIEKQEPTLNAFVSVFKEESLN